MSTRLFGTDGIRGRVGVAPITPDRILHLGWAVGRVLGGKKRSKVIIGKDTRISGYMFESALEAGLSAAGVDVRLLGPMPTPAVAYLTRTLHAQAGIVISASHNSYYDNGIKFFSHRGMKLSDEVELTIEEEMQKTMTTVESDHLGKAGRVTDAAGRYIEFCKSTVVGRLDLSAFKVVIDCAHGATYHIAPYVYEELGAEVVVIGADPDGININEKCGSTHPKALQSAVLKERAHLGIAYDGDGDRLVMVDHTGAVVDGDELLYVLATYWQKIQRLQGAVVGTVMSNLGLEHSLEDEGIMLKRVNVGDRHVMEMLSEHGWNLGGEPSGHMICLDRTISGDGIVASLQVMEVLKRTELSLHDLKSRMRKYPQCLNNVAVSQSPATIMDNAQVKAALKEAESLLGDDGRILLRPSGTEPVIRVMVEGRDPQQVKKVADELAETVKEAAKPT
jgi:phosphoglucosamine mutase